MPIPNHDEAVRRGRLGGMKTKQTMLAKNPYYYEEIGDLGGQTIKREYGIEHYSRIGKMKSKTNRRRGGGYDHEPTTFMHRVRSLIRGR